MKESLPDKEPVKDNTNSTREALKREFYAVLEEKEPFGNEYHEELFDWMCSKMFPVKESEREKLQWPSERYIPTKESRETEQALRDKLRASNLKIKELQAEVERLRAFINRELDTYPKI